MLRYTVTCVIHRCLLAAVLNYTPNIYILPLEGRIVLFCAGPSTLWALRAPVLHFSLLAHKLLHILIHYTCRHHPVIQRSHYISPPVYNTQDFPLCIMHCLDFVFLISLFFKMKVKQKQTKFFHNILIFVLKHVQMTMWLTAGLIMAHMSHMHILSLPWQYVAEHRPLFSRTHAESWSRHSVICFLCFSSLGLYLHLEPSPPPSISPGLPLMYASFRFVQLLQWFTLCNLHKYKRKCRSIACLHIYSHGKHSLFDFYFNSFK